MSYFNTTLCILPEGYNALKHFFLKNRGFHSFTKLLSLTMHKLLIIVSLLPPTPIPSCPLKSSHFRNHQHVKICCLLYSAFCWWKIYHRQYILKVAVFWRVKYLDILTKLFTEPGPSPIHAHPSHPLISWVPCLYFSRPPKPNLGCSDSFPSQDAASQCFQPASPSPQPNPTMFLNFAVLSYLHLLEGPPDLGEEQIYRVVLYRWEGSAGRLLQQPS